MKIAFVAAHHLPAQEAFVALTKYYGQSDFLHADYIVALGGDGHVLKTLYDVIDMEKSVFAMRRTESVGFLCNDYRLEDLPARIEKAHKVKLTPLLLEVDTVDGKHETAIAINEATFIRETPQSARLKILVDGVTRIEDFSGDGILVATPAGSTAYNHSCGGPIMPIDANTLVITAISGYRPRRWSYAVLPQNSMIEVEVQDVAKRPVRIEAGLQVIRNALRARIHLEKTKHLTLLFDPDQNLDERIIREQFMP
jgi:NAD+ kinase